MSIIELLSTIKGKVLDAANFDKLRRAYELQDKNIEQLQNNNKALNESNALLKEKAERLEKENKELKDSVVKMKAFDKTEQYVKLSKVAEAILERCLSEDKTEFNDEDMKSALPFGNIEIETAIDELSQHKLIRWHSSNPYRKGVNYDLTPEGKKFVLRLVPKDK